KRLDDVRNENDVFGIEGRICERQGTEDLNIRVEVDDPLKASFDHEVFEKKRFNRSTKLENAVFEGEIGEVTDSELADRNDLERLLTDLKLAFQPVGEKNEGLASGIVFSQRTRPDPGMTQIVSRDNRAGGEVVVGFAR